MNHIVVLGRLTRDPEVRYAQNGKVVCQFTLAVDRPFVDKETGKKEADFIPVVIWGKQAETAGNGLSKGARCLVEGRVQVRSYTNKAGDKHFVTEIITEHFEFIERREQAAPKAQTQAVEGERVPEPFDPTCDAANAFVAFGEEVPF